jgi:hypothetical protein
MWRGVFVGAFALAGCFSDPPRVEHDSAASTGSTGSSTATIATTASDEVSSGSPSTGDRPTLCDALDPEIGLLCVDFDDGLVPWLAMEGGGPVTVVMPDDVDPPTPPFVLRTELLAAAATDKVSRIRAAADPSWPLSWRLSFILRLDPTCTEVTVLQLGYAGARDISLRLGPGAGALVADGGGGPMPFLFTPMSPIGDAWTSVALTIVDGTTAWGLRGDLDDACVALYDNVIMIAAP